MNIDQVVIFLTGWIQNVSARTTKYVLHVYTGGKIGAGTDAPVSFRFYGEDGKTVVMPEREIDPPGNSFERNS